MTGHSSSGSDPRRQLPPALQLHILSLLPPNERALSCRFVCREAADAFSSADDRTASLGQQLPPHAVPWALEAGQRHVRTLPFWHKFQPLSTAASSGSEVNLEVALSLLQPSVFPELLHGPCYSYCHCGEDPGVAAVRAGHLQLLGWLLSHCPGLLFVHNVIAAAARHCNLADLQAVWEALQAHTSSSSNNTSNAARRLLVQHVLDTAAGSATPDAVPKLQWVLATGQGACRLQCTTARSAMLAGNLELLRWLREQGCNPPTAGNTLDDAYLLGQAASVPMLRWLVDEAGYKLPQPGEFPAFWHLLLQEVARSADGMAKLRWLQDRGAPSLVGQRRIYSFPDIMEAASVEGRLDMLRYLVPLLEPDRGRLPCWYGDDAAASGSIPAVEFLQHAGLPFTYRAYMRAATRGHVAVVRWLAQEAGVSGEGLDLVRFVESWPHRAAAQSRDLLQAVQTVMGAAGCREWNAERVLSAAAGRGDLALVQYLQGQLTPREAQGEQGQGPGQQGQDQPVAWPSGATVLGAAKAGCEALLEWLVERHPGCRTAGGTSRTPYVLAANNGDRGTLATLRRLGVPWGTEDVVVQAVVHEGELPALRWLVEQGAPVGRAKDVEEAVTGRMWGGGISAEEVAWLRGVAGVAEAGAAAAED